MDVQILLIVSDYLIPSKEMLSGLESFLTSVLKPAGLPEKREATLIYFFGPFLFALQILSQKNVKQTHGNSDMKSAIYNATITIQKWKNELSCRDKGNHISFVLHNYSSKIYNNHTHNPLPPPHS
jgi:hypothetical protein